MKPSKELEMEIMEWIFSKSCDDHHAALKIWNRNPWEAVSLYEIAHYPENLGYQLVFPEEVELPVYLMKRLRNEEQWALKGKPIILKYPRASEMTIEVDGEEVEVNKFGRLIIDDDDDLDLGF